MIVRDIPASTLLIALALGYIVCYLANKEHKALKTAGYTIGTFIIVLSSILILAKIIWGIALWSKTCGRMMPLQQRMMREQRLPQMPTPFPQE